MYNSRKLIHLPDYIKTLKVSFSHETLNPSFWMYNHRNGRLTELKGRTYDIKRESIQDLEIIIGPFGIPLREFNIIIHVPPNYYLVDLRQPPEKRVRPIYRSIEIPIKDLDKYFLRYF